MKVYRIEIKGGADFYIGIGGQLFRSRDMAVPCSFEDHLAVMEQLDIEAKAYSEDYDPSVHTMGAIVEKLVKRQTLS